jgi:hypothetical protein
MRVLIFIFFCCPISFSFCNETIRQELDIAWKNEKYADEFITKLEASLTKENQGYLAVAYMMKSNHASMPWTKLKYFYKGKNLLEKAIKEEPERVELRFFRYEIQIKIPKGLKYNNISEDKRIMLDYIQKEQNKMKDVSLYQKIKQLNLAKG